MFYSIGMELDRIYNCDCLEGLRGMESGCVNLVVTSPPYNVGIDYGVHDDNMEYAEYIEWIRSIFSEAYRVLGEDGRMVINVGDGKNGAIPTHSDFIQIAKEIGFSVLTSIIWNKNTTSNRTAWGSFMSASAPSFPRCFEYILVFRKSERLIRKGKSTISKENFIAWSNGMWQMQCEKLSEIGHPAAFPIELPRRCIELFSLEGDVVLDPFMGSGTTAIAAIREGRRFVGFEINEEYWKRTCERVDMELMQPKLF